MKIYEIETSTNQSIFTNIGSIKIWGVTFIPVDLVGTIGGWRRASTRQLLFRNAGADDQLNSQRMTSPCKWISKNCSVQGRKRGVEQLAPNFNRCLEILRSCISISFTPLAG